MCSCDFDGAQAECVTEVTRKARKEHRCYECHRTIPKGDLYVVTSGIWDGEPSRYKWCDTCATVYNLMCGISPGFCFLFGSLHEDVKNCLDECLEHQEAA